MGNLVLKTIKTTKVLKGNTGYITYSEYSGDTNTYNPTQGYINLKPFSVSFPIGVKATMKDNLSRKQPRVSVGGRSNIPITFKLTMSKNEDNDLVDSLIYLSKTAFSDYVSLLYFIPHNDNDIHLTQDRMYWSSLIRILTENIWDNAKLTKSNSGYTDNYDYEPYCVPIKILSISPLSQQANSNMYTVSVNAEVLGMEED